MAVSGRFFIIIVIVITIFIIIITISAISYCFFLDVFGCFCFLCSVSLK